MNRSAPRSVNQYLKALRAELLVGLAADGAGGCVVADLAAGGAAHGDSDRLPVIEPPRAWNKAAVSA
jgi:hypothetical protein